MTIIRIYTVRNVIFTYTVIFSISVKGRIVFISCHRYPKMFIHHACISIEDITKMLSSAVHTGLRISQISGSTTKCHYRNCLFRIYWIYYMHIEIKIKCGTVLCNAIGYILCKSMLYLNIFCVRRIRIHYIRTICIAIPHGFTSVKRILSCLFYVYNFTIFVGFFAYPLYNIICL